MRKTQAERQEIFESERRKTDLAMIIRPVSWPRWPVLPIKRSVKGGFPQTATLFANGKPIVYLVGMYEMEATTENTWDATLAQYDKKEYPDFEAILADGWRVD